jgi:hypothetical protein
MNREKNLATLLSAAAYFKGKSQLWPYIFKIHNKKVA